MVSVAARPVSEMFGRDRARAAPMFAFAARRCARPGARRGGAAAPATASPARGRRSSARRRAAAAVAGLRVAADRSAPRARRSPRLHRRWSAAADRARSATAPPPRAGRARSAGLRRTAASSARRSRGSRSRCGRRSRTVGVAALGQVLRHDLADERQVRGAARLHGREVGLEGLAVRLRPARTGRPRTRRSAEDVRGSGMAMPAEAPPPPNDRRSARHPREARPARQPADGGSSSARWIGSSARAASMLSAATRRSRLFRSASAISAWSRGSPNIARQPRSAAASAPPPPGKRSGTGIAGRSYRGASVHPIRSVTSHSLRMRPRRDPGLGRTPARRTTTKNTGTKKIAEHRRREHAADHAGADRVLRRPSRRRWRDRQRQHAEDEGERGHQDRAQPQRARPATVGVDRRSCPASTYVLRELDDQDRVLRGEADRW